MSAEKFLNRRDLLLQSGALGISTFFSIPKEIQARNDTPSEDEEKPTTDGFPSFISYSEISTDTQVLGASTEMLSDEVQPFTSNFFPYALQEKPTDWIHQPGIAFNKEVDLFLGGYYNNIQTTVWNYVAPVGELITAEAYKDDILTRLKAEQKRQNDSLNLPHDHMVMDEPLGEVREVAGIIDGWLITASMTGYGENHINHHQVNTGFIKDNLAFQFNQILSIVPEHLGEYDKFMNMVESVQIKR